MVNVVIAGVGGQGTVLAAKVLATSAAARGLKVRTAETIGMSQRGGSVVSHVRMAGPDEPIHSSLVMPGRADAIIAFEPGEGARVLSYLAPSGTVVTATTALEPTSAALACADYDGASIVAAIASSLRKAATPAGEASLVAVDDAAITRGVAGGRKALNTVMLAAAVATGCLPINIEDLKQAVAQCVKPAFRDMNTEAIDAAVRAVQATPAARAAGAAEQE